MMKIAVSIPDLHFRAESLAQFQFSFYDRLIPSLSLSPSPPFRAFFPFARFALPKKGKRERKKEEREKGDGSSISFHLIKR